MKPFQIVLLTISLLGIAGCSSGLSGCDDLLNSIPSGIEDSNKLTMLDGFKEQCQSEPLFYNNKAWAYMSIGKPLDALEAANEGLKHAENINDAIELMAAQASALTTLAENLDQYREQRLKTASKIYQEILQASPNYVDAFTGLGRIATLKKDWENAESNFSKALSLDKAPQKYNNLLVLYVRADNYKKFIPLYIQAINTFPNELAGNTDIAAYAIRELYKNDLKSEARYVICMYGVQLDKIRTAQDVSDAVDFVIESDKTTLRELCSVIPPENQSSN